MIIRDGTRFLKFPEDIPRVDFVGKLFILDGKVPFTTTNPVVLAAASAELSPAACDTRDLQLLQPKTIFSFFCPCQTLCELCPKHLRQ